MRPSRLLLAALFALVGVVWIGQGAGIIGGSMMTGSGSWPRGGAGLLVAPPVVGVVEGRRPG